MVINFWKLAYKSVKEQLDQHKEENEQLKEENKDLKHENKALRLQADTYFDEWQNEKVKKEDS